MAITWFYYDDQGNAVGPISSATLKSLAEKELVRPDTLVRREDSNKWVAAGQIKGLYPGVHPAVAANPKPDKPVGDLGVVQSVQPEEETLSIGMQIRSLQKRSTRFPWLAASLPILTLIAFMVGRGTALRPIEEKREWPDDMVASQTEADCLLPTYLHVHVNEESLAGRIKEEEFAGTFFYITAQSFGSLRTSPSLVNARKTAKYALFFADSFEKATRPLDYIEKRIDEYYNGKDGEHRNVALDSWLACMRLKDLGVDVDLEEFMSGAVWLRMNSSTYAPLDKTLPQPKFREYCHAYQELRLNSKLSHGEAIRVLHESKRF